MELSTCNSFLTHFLVNYIHVFPLDERHRIFVLWKESSLVENNEMLYQQITTSKLSLAVLPSNDVSDWTDLLKTDFLQKLIKKNKFEVVTEKHVSGCYLLNITYLGSYLIDIYLLKRTKNAKDKVCFQDSEGHIIRNTELRRFRIFHYWLAKPRYSKRIRNVETSRKRKSKGDSGSKENEKVNNEIVQDDDDDENILAREKSQHRQKRIKA